MTFRKQLYSAAIFIALGVVLASAGLSAMRDWQVWAVLILAALK
jgi:hypothetical protein